MDKLIAPLLARIFPGVLAPASKFGSTAASVYDIGTVNRVGRG